MSLTPERRLFTFIPYSCLHLGAASNEAMHLLGPDDWACILDHDVLFCRPDWHPVILSAIEMEPYAFFSCFNNRQATKKHMLPDAPLGDNFREHWQFGIELAQCKKGLEEVTGLIGGFCMILSKRTWLQCNGFADLPDSVDHDFSRRLDEAGIRKFLINGLYAYHWRRGIELRRRKPHATS